MNSVPFIVTTPEFFTIWIPHQKNSQYSLATLTNPKRKSSLKKLHKNSCYEGCALAVCKSSDLFGKLFRPEYNSSHPAGFTDRHNLSPYLSCAHRSAQSWNVRIPIIHSPAKSHRRLLWSSSFIWTNRTCWRKWPRPWNVSFRSSTGAPPSGSVPRNPANSPSISGALRSQIITQSTTEIK